MMRRRFGRRRRGGDTGRERRRARLDAAREFAELGERGVLGAASVVPIDAEDPASELAAVGIGDGAPDEPEGRRVVAWSPTSGADAWLAGLAVAARLAESEAFAGELLVLSPAWPLSARRRLELAGELPFGVRAVAVGDPRGVPVSPEALEPAVVVEASRLVAALARGEDRALFARAVSVLEGLAAKHEGGVRVELDRVELVARGEPVAALHADGEGVVLETLAGRRSHARLASEALAESFDRLEGLLRKQLSDQKILSGESGLRSRLAPTLASVEGVRDSVPWPLGGDPSPLDFVGADASGRVVLGAVRRELGLASLGPLLDAAVAIRPRLAALLAKAAPPLSFDAPRLALAAERVDASAIRVLARLTLEATVHEVAGAADARGARLRRIALERPTSAPALRRRPTPAPAAPSLPPTAPAAAEAETRPPRFGAFEEFSVFELEEETPEDEVAARRRRRRRRGRGRGRRGVEGGGPERRLSAESSEEQAEEETGGPEEAEETPPPLVVGSEEDLEEGLAPLDADVPEFVPEPEPAYDDEEEVESEPWEAERDRRRREIEARRRGGTDEPASEPQAPRRPPRRRAAIVAHADRDAIGAAVLLARDLRLVEGLWIYPQEDLMTFFRSVATDLREETPIYAVGFTVSPARETLQAASLYRERLFWFDHHEWPPEDLEGLRAAIGSDAVHVEPAAGSSLPAVLSVCTRRSRFSDKLVDLLSARFTHHDYERWGRLWWWRLGEAAAHTGERRADVEALLVGRPSDLAREAERVETAPVPPEASYVAGRDFRIVHFGGYVLVLVPTPPDLAPGLAARIARERYGAHLSLAWAEGEDRLLLGGNELAGRQAPDLEAMVDHLEGKFDWVKPLPRGDHVARFRVADRASHPARLEEVIGEIAMGRSILEG